MILTHSSGVRVENPTDDEIRTLLGWLNVSRDGEGFAILGPDDMTYMQVGGDGKTGFDMEWQEGDTKKHYRFERTDFTLDDVLRAMSAYRDGGIRWADFGQWSQLRW